MHLVRCTALSTASHTSNAQPPEALALPHGASSLHYHDALHQAYEHMQLTFPAFQDALL